MEVPVFQLPPPLNINTLFGTYNLRRNSSAIPTRAANIAFNENVNDYILRSGLSDEIRKNTIYRKYAKNDTNKIDYLNNKKGMLAYIDVIITEKFRDIYTDYLDLGYTQEDARKIATEIVSREKKILMEDFKKEYPI